MNLPRLPKWMAVSCVLVMAAASAGCSKDEPASASKASVQTEAAKAASGKESASEETKNPATEAKASEDTEKAEGINSETAADTDKQTELSLTEAEEQASVITGPAATEPDAELTDGKTETLTLTEADSDIMKGASTEADPASSAPEKSTEAEALPDSATEAETLPDSATEAEAVPDSATEAEKDPDSAREAGKEPDASTEAETLPDASTEAETELNIEELMESIRLQAESEKDFALAAALETARKDMDETMAKAAAEAESERVAAVMEAERTAESEKEAALKEAEEKAEADKEAALDEARKQAESEKEAALKEAKEQAESDKNAAIAGLKADAESEKEAALKAAEEKAEAEKEAALKAAEEKAEAEKEAALKAAEEKAEAEKEAALKEAEKKAEAEKEAALKAAEEEAEARKEAALKEAEETARSELNAAMDKARADAEQGLIDARVSWESEKESEKESELEAIADSTVVAACDTILFSEPDENSSVITKIREGAPVSVISKTEGLTKVDYYGIKGFVNGSDLYVPNGMKETVAAAPGLEIWYMPEVKFNSHLNVRKNPGVDSEWITSLGPGQKVPGTGQKTEDGSWIEVIYDAEGNTGWVSAAYAREDTEGAPDLLTENMYFAEYGRIADFLRDNKTDTVTAIQDGQETYPGYATGFATLISDNWLYTGNLEDGRRNGKGTLVGIFEDDPKAYVVISGSWLNDQVDGNAVWSYYTGENEDAEIMIRGGILSNYWDGEVEITGNQDGEVKHYYCTPKNGEYAVMVEADGRYGIAKNPDGSYWYVDSEEELSGNGVGLNWDNEG